MDSLTDYANWKKEKSSLITTLKELDSNIIKRYNNVLAVLDHLYDLAINKKKQLSEDESVIFDVGLEYLDNNFITLEDILKKYCHNNVNEMEKSAKAVNLLLYAMDLEDEFLNNVSDSDPNIRTDLEELEDFEEVLYDYIVKQKDVEDALAAKLDDITIKIFTKHHIEINPIDSIFYDIAETYGLNNNDTFDFNKYFNDKIAHDKTCDHEGH